MEFPAASGFAAAFALLPSLQRLMIDLAGRHVPRVGEPVRSHQSHGHRMSAKPRGPKVHVIGPRGPKVHVIGPVGRSSMSLAM